MIVLKTFQSTTLPSHEEVMRVKKPNKKSEWCCTFWDTFSGVLFGVLHVIVPVKCVKKTWVSDGKWEYWIVSYKKFQDLVK